MALQELDVNNYSCPGYVDKFRKCTVGLTFFEEFVSRRFGVDIAHTPHRFFGY